MFALSSPSERDQLRSHPGASDPQHEHGVHRGAPALGGRARIQDPEMLEALHLRYVGMTVDDCLAVLEAGRESRLPPRARTGVIDEPDPDVAGRDDAPLRQARPEL